MDFVLWKPSLDEDPGWDSPWGRGRPGWHLECSVMSEKYLGKQFDIHGGGLDLIFPHHENEMAQSCCNNSTNEFSNYWVHNGFVTINNEKMSKSLGNIVTISNAVKKYSGQVVRLALLSAHYSQPLDWNDTLLKNQKATIDKWYNLYDGSDNVISLDEVENLLDDLNTPKLLAHLNTLANKLSTANRDEKINIKNNLIAAGKLLGILSEDPDVWLGYNQSLNPDKEEIEGLINQRNEARRDKDFKLADEIRDKLNEMNIELIDHKGQTIWMKKEKIKKDC